MRVYLASAFRNREMLRGYQDQIRAAGHTCACRWLTDPTHRIEVDHLPGSAAEFNRMLAFHDLHDLGTSDTCVFFGPGGTRGGCHVEVGIALAQGKRLLWVGDRTHVFSWLPQIEQFPTWGDCFLAVFAQPEKEEG